MCFRLFFGKKTSEETQPLNSEREYQPGIAKAYSLAGGIRFVDHQPDARPGVNHKHRLYDHDGCITVVCTHPNGPELRKIDRQITRYLNRGLR